MGFLCFAIDSCLYQSVEVSFRVGKDIAGVKLDNWGWKYLVSRLGINGK